VALAIFPPEKYTDTITTDLFAADETSYFDDAELFFALQREAVEELRKHHEANAAWVKVTEEDRIPERQYRKALTTDLSRIRGSFVIGRHTAFTYKGNAVDLMQIGRELNVRYVLEGSVQRGGNRVRVGGQEMLLSEAEAEQSGSSFATAELSSKDREKKSRRPRRHWDRGRPIFLGLRSDYLLVVGPEAPLRVGSRIELESAIKLLRTLSLVSHQVRGLVTM
jgi:hypothetical protein